MLSNQQWLQTTRLRSPAHKARWHALPWWNWMRGLGKSSVVEKNKWELGRLLEESLIKERWKVWRASLNFFWVPENLFNWTMRAFHKTCIIISPSGRCCCCFKHPVSSRVDKASHYGVKAAAVCSIVLITMPPSQGLPLLSSCSLICKQTPLPSVCQQTRIIILQVLSLKTETHSHLNGNMLLIQTQSIICLCYWIWD